MSDTLHALTTANSDYLPAVQTLTLLPVEDTPVCVQITVLDDSVLEETEDFFVWLTSSDEAVEFARNTSRILIPNTDRMDAHNMQIFTKVNVNLSNLCRPKCLHSSRECISD